MPKPKRVDRPVPKHIHFSQSLVDRVDLHLYSELEGRVPFGAWQKFITELVEGYFQQGGERESFLKAAKQIYLDDGQDNGFGDPEAYHSRGDRIMEAELTRLGYDVTPLTKGKRYYA